MSFKRIRFRRDKKNKFNLIVGYSRGNEKERIMDSQNEMFYAYNVESDK